MRVNVASMMLMAKYAIPEMRKLGAGAIVNLGSVAGLTGGHPHLLYPTSKGAIVQMTRAMAAHHGREGIRVNCVCPGMVYTPMVYAAGMTQDTRDRRRRRSLLQTEGTGWDVASAVLYLVSDDARWVTGTILTVDAGATAGMGSLPLPNQGPPSGRESPLVPAGFLPGLDSGRALEELFEELPDAGVAGEGPGLLRGLPLVDSQELALILRAEEHAVGDVARLPGHLFGGPGDLVMDLLHRRGIALEASANGDGDRHFDHLLLDRFRLRERLLACQALDAVHLASVLLYRPNQLVLVLGLVAPAAVALDSFGHLRRPILEIQHW